MCRSNSQSDRPFILSEHLRCRCTLCAQRRRPGLQALLQQVSVWLKLLIVPEHAAHRTVLLLPHLGYLLIGRILHQGLGELIQHQEPAFNGLLGEYCPKFP